jgi:hypothetical protein
MSTTTATGRGLAVTAVVALLSGGGTAAHVSAQPPSPPDYQTRVCASAPDAAFPDLPPSHYASSAVACLKSLGLLHGHADGTFRPDEPVSRASAAVALGRVAVSVTFEALFDSNAQPPFNDLQGVTDEQRLYVQGLYNRGVIRGVTPTAFAPDRLLERGQAASLLARTHTLVRRQSVVPPPSPLPPGGDQFSDDDTSVHEEAIQRLTATGVLQGTSSTTYQPQAPLTRAQLALVLARYLQLVSDTSGN